MTKHLRYEMQDAPTGHPQAIMRELGITYQDSTPQSLGDQWWFWNCKGMPEKLPAYLTELKLNPIDAIGYGLSRERAEAIVLASQNADNNY